MSTHPQQQPTAAPTGKTLEELAREQGVAPVADPAELAADFWPEEETADDFLAAARAWRKEGRRHEGGS